MNRIEEIEAWMEDPDEKCPCFGIMFSDIRYLLNRTKELETELAKAKNEWKLYKDLTLDQYCRSLPCDYKPLQEYLNLKAELKQYAESDHK